MRRFMARGGNVDTFALLAPRSLKRRCGLWHIGYSTNHEHGPDIGTNTTTSSEDWADPITLPVVTLLPLTSKKNPNGFLLPII